MKVYSRLLNEGTEVFRPAQAVELGGGLFKLEASGEHNNLSDEKWEILPGSTIRIEPRRGIDGEFTLAIPA